MDTEIHDEIWRQAGEMAFARCPSRLGVFSGGHVRPFDTLLYRHANRDRMIVPKRQDVNNSGIPKSHCKNGVSLKFLEKAT
jgi:hypothetical protein